MVTLVVAFEDVDILWGTFGGDDSLIKYAGDLP